MARMKKVETSEALGAVVPYSQGTEPDGLIFISGQLPVNPKIGQMLEEDIAVQAHRVIENIWAVLNVTGSDLSRVVRCEVFLKDMNGCKVINEVYASKFVSDPKPARQAVQVGRLPLDAMVEISCIVRKG